MQHIQLLDVPTSNRPTSYEDSLERQFFREATERCLRCLRTSFICNGSKTKKNTSPWNECWPNKNGLATAPADAAGWLLVGGQLIWHQWTPADPI